MKFLIIDDEHELYKIMYSDLFKPNEYSIEEIPRLVVPPVLQKLKRLHFNEKINRHWWIPGKSIWNKYYELSKYKFNNEEDYVIIFLNGTLRHYYSKEYLMDIKNKHKNVKLVMVLYDSFADPSAKRAIDMIEIFDMIFSFDVEDSNKYGFEHIYSTFSVPNKLEVDKKLYSKAFFIGNAAGRLNMLQSFMKEIALKVKKCDFTIVGVKKEKQKFNDYIKYNKYLPYMQVLQKSYNTDCIIEILKPGQTGVSLRTCEAILFNKKLLTNNDAIKDMPFYDERFMRVFHNVDDIDYEFLNKDIEVRYESNNYFSPLIIIEKIMIKNLFER